MSDPLSPANGPDIEPNQHTVRYDGHPREPPSTRVIYAVSEATGSTPAEMRPLYEVIEPDALDDIVGAEARTKGNRAASAVSFRYEGCTITFDPQGALRLAVPDASSP